MTSSFPALTPEALHPAGLPDNVYELLVQELSWGDLVPGSPLSIDGLSRQLGVSPTPVREALARLEATGMVTREARRGYRVAPPMSDEQMAELLEVRRILETSAVRMAMRNPKPLLKSLEKAFRSQQKVQQRYDRDPSSSRNRALVREYCLHDWAFHQAFLDHCGNCFLSDAVNGLSFQVHRMRQRITHASLAVTEHHLIVEAVRAGDAEAAVAAMLDHLDAVEIRMTGAKKQPPPEPTARR